MKITYKLPDPTPLFGHDAILIKVIKIALPLFALISAITVFTGVKAQVEEYVIGFNVIYSTLAYLIGFTLFSFAPDLLNIICFGYVVRSILKGFYKDVTSWILILSALILVGGLTEYSYKMSQTAAISKANHIKGKIENYDSSLFDKMEEKEKNELQVNKELSLKLFYENIDNEVNSNRELLNKKKAEFQHKIRKWEIKRKPSNTQYIDTKIRNIKTKVIENETSLLEQENELIKKKSKYTSELESKYDLDLKDIKAKYDANRLEAKKTFDLNNENGNQVFEVFRNKFSSIAGKSVFIILILSMLKEILYHRNGIEPTPILQEFDFTEGPIFEVIRVIPTAITVFMINGVRWVKRKLPKLAEPLKPSRVYDLSTRLPEIVKEKPNKKGSARQAPSMNMKVRKSEEVEITAEIGIDKSHKEKQKETNVNDDRIDDPKTNHLRSCEHCEKEYVYNSKKQKYCSEVCRITAWEKRTGRKLKKKVGKT